MNLYSATFKQNFKYALWQAILAMASFHYKYENSPYSYLRQTTESDKSVKTHVSNGIFLYLTSLISFLPENKWPFQLWRGDQTSVC